MFHRIMFRPAIVCLEILQLKGADYRKGKGNLFMCQNTRLQLSSFGLHMIAMGLMLCDHLWAMLFPAEEWLTCIGRIAFPIFAFMVVEGYLHTHDLRR